MQWNINVLRLMTCPQTCHSKRKKERGRVRESTSLTQKYLSKCQSSSSKGNFLINIDWSQRQKGQQPGRKNTHTHKQTYTKRTEARQIENENEESVRQRAKHGKKKKKVEL